MDLFCSGNTRKSRLRRQSAFFSYSLGNRSERSSASVSADIHEENDAHSEADFAIKFQIALKECGETEYRLALFVIVISEISEWMERETD